MYRHLLLVPIRPNEPVPTGMTDNEEAITEDIEETNDE